MIHEVKKLNTVASVGAGNSAPQDEKLFFEGTNNFYRTSDVGKIKVGEISNSADKLNGLGIKGLKLFKAGTILFPKSGASTFLNHRVMIAKDGYVSSHLATIKANNEFLLDKYLLFFLQTVDAKNLVADSGYPSLKTSVIGEIEIPIPPLEIQQKIVDRLDAAFFEIEKSIAIAKDNLLNVSTIYKKYSNEIFLTDSPEYIKTNLKDVTEVITCGVAKRPTYVDEGVPFLSARNVKNGKMKWDRYEFITEAAHHVLSKHNKPRIGDILYSRVGAGFGDAAIIDRDIEFSIFVSLTLLKVKPVLLNTFLCHYLNSPLIKKLAGENITGTGVGNLNVGAVRQFPINLPPLNKQKEIVIKLDSLRDEADKLEEIYKEKINKLVSLKEAFLTESFSITSLKV